MPSLLDIRRRIRAVKSTQQITKAMKMVAASKLRRAQERIQQARPFATQMLRVLSSLASRVDPSSHPLLDERTPPKAGGRVLLIVITADRGLCGSFNTNVIKATGQFITEKRRRARWRSAWSAAAAATSSPGAGSTSGSSRSTCSRSSSSSTRKAIARAAIDAFMNGEVDSVYLVYNEFKSVMVQRVVVEQLLPIPRRRRVEAADGTARAADRLPLRAGAGAALHARCCRRHVEVQVFRALLESNAAFFAAQMTAMDAATRNSGEMIESLTLYMNKVRQAAITRRSSKWSRARKRL